MPQFRLAAVGVTAALLLFTGAAAAQAHVRLTPDDSASGGFAKLTFRVPTESDTAGTTKVSIALPTATPLAFVSAQAVPGWTVTMQKGKLPKPVTLEGTTLTEATTRVTWTAKAGSAVAPGEFQEFALSAGPLPAARTQMLFPADQTYSDGTVVKWDQPQAPGAAEPEHPAPSFTVTAAQTEGGTSSDDDASAAALTSSPTASGPAATSDDTARWLAGGGLVAGLLGLALGAFAFVRSGRRSAS